MAIQLIVGLSNPGEAYAKTRHNAGAWFVEELARRFGVSFREESKFEGNLARIEKASVDCRLLIPLTYMNASGRSVSELASFFKIPLGDILIVHDDLDLPVGSIRLKKGGGHGGHNGLRDILSALGGDGFWRLRIGIGHPGQREEVIGYVLHSPSQEERQKINGALELALDSMESIFAGKLDQVMSVLNRGKEDHGAISSGS